MKFKIKFTLYIGMVIGLVTVPIAYSKTPKPWDESVFGKIYPANILYSANPDSLISDTSNINSKSNPEGILDLSDVFALTLLLNPELAAYSLEVRAGEAREWQAMFRPNPELALVVEDFAKFGKTSGKSSSKSDVQTTLELSQNFEMGGKRAARKATAAQSLKWTEWEYRSKRLEILYKVSRAMIEVTAAQRALKIAEEEVSLAKQITEAISMHVKNGRASQVEASQVRLMEANAAITLEWAKHRLDEAKEGLAALWSSPEPRFQSAVDYLDSLVSVPDYESLLKDLEQHPDLMALEAEVARDEAGLEWEKALAIPDITFKGGYRDFGLGESGAFVAGISLPLPTANRNQGKISEAKHNIAKLRKRKNLRYIELRGELAEAFNVAKTSEFEIHQLKDNILPVAGATLETYTEGYKQGRYSYLEVLNGQKSLSEFKGQYLKALTAYHLALAHIEALTSKALQPSLTLTKRH